MLRLSQPGRSTGRGGPTCLVVAQSYQSIKRKGLGSTPSPLLIRVTPQRS